jgi:hypothetical protein
MDKKQGEGKGELDGDSQCRFLSINLLKIPRFATKNFFINRKAGRGFLPAFIM